MYSVPKNMRIATNFLLSEFACKDGSKTVIVDFELLFLLQCLRDVVGRVIVTSAYRTPEYNKKVGGIANSFHLDGKARPYDGNEFCPRCRCYRILCE